MGGTSAGDSPNLYKRKC